MTFPAEAVPDGHVAAPHHLYVGVLIATFAVWVVADNKARQEPLLAAVGVLFALFGFALVWQWYPGTGAAMTFAGLVLILAGVTWPGGMWSGYPLYWRGIAFVGAVIGFDDAVSHALGVWTPLDAVWNVGIYQLLP